jgi:hypothetical protein
VLNELMMFRAPAVFQNGGVEKISALQTFHHLNLEACDSLLWGDAEGFYEKSAASGTG